MVMTIDEDKCVMCDHAILGKQSDGKGCMYYLEGCKRDNDAFFTGGMNCKEYEKDGKVWKNTEKE